MAQAERWIDLRVDWDQCGLCLLQDRPIGKKGRVGFASLCLPWERPFLGPLYAWAAAIMGQKGEMQVPWAILFILGWVKKRKEEIGWKW